jgi:hypothetical protein
MGTPARFSIGDEVEIVRLQPENISKLLDVQGYINKFYLAQRKIGKRGRIMNRFDMADDVDDSYDTCYYVAMFVTKDFKPMTLVFDGELELVGYEEEILIAEQAVGKEALADWLGG